MDIINPTYKAPGRDKGMQYNLTNRSITLPGAQSEDNKFDLN